MGFLVDSTIKSAAFSNSSIHDSGVRAQRENVKREEGVGKFGSSH
jgi:hypothetical protein